jgi:Pyridoxamine 5'-phosphate oxidase
MAKVYEGIAPRLAKWIERQPMFFVATAPLAADGHVNLSPKGTRGTFKVLDAHTFAYVDLGGSGIETVAHLRENGRICVMFCSFEHKPDIVRLHGKGTVTRRGEEGFAEALTPFSDAALERIDAVRAVVSVAVNRVSDSCGYTVPLMDFREERRVLDQRHRQKGAERLARDRLEQNAQSLDGLPALAE